MIMIFYDLWNSTAKALIHSNAMKHNGTYLLCSSLLLYVFESISFFEVWGYMNLSINIFYIHIHSFQYLFTTYIWRILFKQFSFVFFHIAKKQEWYQEYDCKTNLKHLTIPPLLMWIHFYILPDNIRWLARLSKNRFIT